MPAIAAALGVLRCARVRVPFFSIAIGPFCFGAVGR